MGFTEGAWCLPTFLSHHLPLRIPLLADVTFWGLGAKTKGPSTLAQGVGEPHLNQHGGVARNCSSGDGEERCQPLLMLWGPPAPRGVPAPSYQQNGGLPEAAHQQQAPSKAAPFHGEARARPSPLSAQLSTGCSRCSDSLLLEDTRP